MTRLDIRRVTAVLESGGPDAGLVATAAEVAARLRAPLQGLLLQDANLHRLAELGIARIVSRFAGAGPEPASDAAGMLEWLTAQAQAALDVAAATLGIPWSFQVLQGDATVDLPQTLDPGELLVFDISSSWSGRDARRAAAVWRATERRSASMLLIDRRLRQLAPAVLLHRPSPAAEQALAVAAAMLASPQQELSVLLAAAPDDAAATVAWIRQRHPAQITLLGDQRIATLVRAAGAGGSNLLLIPGDAPLLHRPEAVLELGEQAEVALMLLR